jgi:hypothetical protein
VRSLFILSEKNVAKELDSLEGFSAEGRGLSDWRRSNLLMMFHRDLGLGLSETS